MQVENKMGNERSKFYIHPLPYPKPTKPGLETIKSSRYNEKSTLEAASVVSVSSQQAKVISFNNRQLADDQEQTFDHLLDWNDRLSNRFDDARSVGGFSDCTLVENAKQDIKPRFKAGPIVGKSESNMSMTDDEGGIQLRRQISV